MKKIVMLSAVVSAMLVFAGPVLAETNAWVIDKVHSNIYFDIRHTYATVRGQFDEFSGTVRFNPENKLAGAVNFTVDVASINTYIDERDKHLRSADFFDAEKFPHMTFKSSRVRQVEENRYMLEGELTIKGVSKPVSIPFTYLGLRDNPLEKGKMVAGFEAEFSLNRLDYNVGSGQFAKMGVVGETVRVLVTLELLKDK